jgi:hypothetical protein
MSVDSSSELFSVNVGDKAPECIGLLDGNGYYSCLDWTDTAKWFIIESNNAVALDGHCEVRNGIVVACGTRKEATDFLLSKGKTGVHGAFHTTGDVGTSTSGDKGTSTSGNSGTSTSGDWGTSTSGYSGTSTSGNRGTSTSGDSGTSTSGNNGTSTSGRYGISTSGSDGTSTSGDWGTSTSEYYGTSTSGNGGTSTSGYCGTSTSGYCGTSTSGDHGTSTSGNSGTSMSGNYGTSTSGNYGTSMSGEDGKIVINYYDGKRYRNKTGYIGEDGLLPNVPYQLNSNNEFEINVEKALPMESVSIDLLMPYMAQVIQFEESLLNMERTPRVEEILELIRKYKPLVA